MAIVDLAFYMTSYYGDPVDPCDFPRMEAKAERLITQITHGRASNFDTLPAFQQAAIKDAICAQVEYYSILGTDVSVVGDTGGAGWTVGKVHVNGGSGASGKTGASSMVCAAAVACLEQTGLLNPQVVTIGQPPQAWPWGVI